jgi:UDP-glucose 4-epimerase
VKKVLITGGCGFVGTNLTDYLLSAGGHEITLLDNLSNAVFDTSNLTALGLRIVRGDVRDPRACDVAAGQDVVIHLAAYTQVVESLRNPSHCYDVNLHGTINLLEACRRHGVERFLFASSNAAVGSHDAAMNEQNVPRPISPYGATKLAGEALCSAYARSYGIAAISLRFSNVYGPYCQRKSSVIAKFMRTMFERKPLTIYGDGLQSRDFVHVTDLCHAIALCVSQPEVGLAGEVFQVASGVETRIVDLVELLEQVIGSKTELRFEAARIGEILKNGSDISKIRNRIGFVPTVGLESGIRLLHGWFESASLKSVLVAGS